MARARVSSKRRSGGPFVAARPLQVLGWTVAALFAVTVLGLVVFDRKDDPLCATRSQRALIQSELARNPRVWLVDLAHDMHVPEAVVLDALPDSERAGVRGSELADVWNWLRRQPDLVLALHNGRHTWRVRGSLPELKPVQRGDWHIGTEDDVLSGRISTMDVGVIYARSGRGANDPPWSVLFLDRAGEVLFQVAPISPSGANDAAAHMHAGELLGTLRNLDTICRSER